VRLELQEEAHIAIEIQFSCPLFHLLHTTHIPRRPKMPKNKKIKIEKLKTEILDLVQMEVKTALMMKNRRFMIFLITDKLDFKKITLKNNNRQK